MDRKIVYTGQVPLGNDFLNTNKNVMLALGVALKAIIGTATIFDGLACTPTGPASLQVLVGPGSVYSLVNVDATAYGNLSADTTHQIVKQGIVLDTTALTCTPPTTTGFSTNFLIQATYQDQDVDSAVLPYFNAANPPVAFNGPSNSGTSQNTTRKGALVISLKAGTAAATGTQTTPAPDAGFTGLWVVRVPNGATAITSGNISLYTGSGAATGSTAFWSTPFIAERLTDKVSIATGDLRWQPIGGGGGARTVLSTNTTFHISTTGNDSTGTGSSGAPWATMQHAVNVIADTIDLAGFTATIQCADGTYTSPVSVNAPFTGGGSVVLQGNVGTPSNCIISTTSANCIDVQNNAVLYLGGGFKLQTTTGGNCLNANEGGKMFLGGALEYGICAGSHIVAQGGGAQVFNTGNALKISGGSTNHLSCGIGAVITEVSATITMTGTPAFANAYATAQNIGCIVANGNTYSGGATGLYFDVSLNAVINTGGGGPTYFPGSTTGTQTTGGEYA